MFSGKVLAITGASEGIGAELARQVSGKGVWLALAARNLEKLEAVAAECRARGAEAVAIRCDVAAEVDCRHFIEEAVRKYSSLDILVNNAGITRDNLIHKMTDDDWDSVAAVHLKGAFLCSRAAQREMVKRNWGRIVNLSSVSALGNRGQTNYSTAKAGLQGMAKTLAIELGRYGITVNAVAPGFIDTEMTRAVAIRLGRDPEEWKEERAREIPVRRAGVPRDIANVIAFLCSEEASFVSGQVIYVAGGPRG
jgi:3-oxoacyl-[acyl-carrier protein] reductase